MFDVVAFNRRMKCARRRSKKACESLANMILRRPLWKCRIVPSSGAGKMDEEKSKNVWADLEAFYHGEPTIYVAIEVKTSIKKNKVYIHRPSQIAKLFANLNVVPVPKRYAVFCFHKRKQWRFMILRSFHMKLNYIGLSLTSTKNVFSNINSLLEYIEKDARVYFPLEGLPKTEVALGQ